jgi:hypothetical protein
VLLVRLHKLYMTLKCVELYLHPPYVFMESCFVRHKDNFTSAFTYLDLGFDSREEQADGIVFLP